MSHKKLLKEKVKNKKSFYILMGFSFYTRLE